MKYIIRLFVGMVVFLAATSCHTSEIDNPDNTKPNGQPSDSELSITASIIQTRVTYTDDTETLNQQWEDGDVLFGYIGGEAKEENRVSFTVSYVDPTTHIATLDAGSYKSTLLSSVGKFVDLVYTGQEQPYQADGSVNVIMSSQSANGKIPACMHSRATVTKENNVISLNFKFYNDCAIFEIVSLTGVNEENLSMSLSLSSIEATNLYQEGKYTLGANGFEFEGVEDRMGDVSLALGGNWKVNTDGTITDGNTSIALMAVVPIAETDKKNIKFTSTTNTSQDFSFDYGAHKLEAGVCYVIGAKPVVAKTEDGQYFTSVSAAFNHASTLVSTFGENNKVTLVNELIYGLRDNSLETNAEYLPAKITINYPVILDLNGCTLSLDCLEDDTDYDAWLMPFNSYYGGGFEVKTNGALTIIDEKDCGCIDSCSECPIITNSGTVNVVSGSLVHWTNGTVVDNTGELNVSSGTISSSYGVAIENDSQNLNISGGEIDGHYALKNNEGAKANITGGSLRSTDDSAVVNYGDLIVGDPNVDEDDREPIEIISNADILECPAIYNSSSNGSFNIYYGNIIGVWGAVEIKGGLQGNIYGGYFESTNEATILIIDGGKCDISGGVVYNKEGGTSPAVLCYSGDFYDAAMSDDDTSLTIRWPNNDEDVGIYIHEPLIYTNTKNSVFCSPVMVSRSGNEEPNFAKININGGILYSGNGAFYRQVIPEKSKNPEKVGDADGYLNPLKTGNITSFYSNSYSLYEGSNKIDLSTDADSVYGLTAIFQTGSGFQKTIDGIKVSFDNLYKISK